MTRKIYEILIRGRLDGEGSNYDPKGSHVRYGEARPGRPDEISDPVALHLADELPSAIRDLFANSAQQIAAAEQATDDMRTERDAAREEIETLTGERDKLRTTLEAAAAEAISTARAHTETVAAMQAQIDSLKGKLPPNIVYLSDVWKRATDEEAVAIETMINGLSPKDRQRLNSSQYLDPADIDFPRILQALTATVGAERARELIAPSQVS